MKSKMLTQLHSLMHSLMHSLSLTGLGSLASGAVTLSAVALTSLPAFSQEETSTVTAPAPRTEASAVRLVPVAGASSFADDEVDFDNLDEGLSLGILADFGDDTVVFESGVMTLQSDVDTDADTDTTAIDVDTWGIPLLAKVNFSDNPHSTVFLKAGAMPFTSDTDDGTDFDVMGVAGLGAHIPLGRNSSFLLEGTYNRNVTAGGDLPDDYQGISLLAGVSLNL